MWRINRKYLKDEEFIQYLTKHINEFITLNLVSPNSDKPLAHIIWDAFKAYIWGIIIAFSCKKKKINESDKRTKELK